MSPKAQIQVVSNLEPEITGENIKWMSRLPQNELVTHYEKSNLLIYIDNNREFRLPAKYMSYWQFGFTHIVCLYLRIRKLPFCQNFKWVHFVNNDETSIYNYLMEYIWDKELSYFPEYHLVKSMNGPSWPNFYYQKLEVVV